MTAQRKAEDFVTALQDFGTRPGIFNPWLEVDLDYDASKKSPDIRAENLVRYLAERVGVAENALIAEAPGYQGCHFSGIAMTSERILLGHLQHKGIHAHHVFQGATQRTSKLGPKTPEKGANEPTATIVWGHMANENVCTRSVVLWNTFAFHPHKGESLTNRRPSPDEVEKGRYLLEMFIDMFPKANLVPIGRVAEETLANMSIACTPYVRHPANGGAALFRAGVSAHWKGFVKP